MPSPILTQLPSPPPGKTGWPWTEETHLAQSSILEKDWPRITIVTPSFNQARYLGRNYSRGFAAGLSQLGIHHNRWW